MYIEGHVEILSSASGCHLLIIFIDLSFQHRKLFNNNIIMKTFHLSIYTNIKMACITIKKFKN